jgi:N-acetylglucosamine-6-sulfatase
MHSLPRLLLLALALALPFSSAPAADAAKPKRPNVLFILCDDLRPAALGCYGSKEVRTPNIDRLAREGVLFRNTFCTTSLCSPSRASILTGLYAHGHGVRDNFTELPPNLTHWPQRLREEGYETAYLGKWHMGEDNDMPRWGFDWFVTHKGQGKYFDTEWNFGGQRRAVVKGYYTTVVTDMALDWLGIMDSPNPWALCIGHKAPHSFYTPEPKYAHTFDSVRVPYPQTAFELDDKPAWIKERLHTWHGIYGPLFEWRKQFPDDRPEAVKDFEAMVHGYWGTILSVDDSVGRIVAMLKEHGQLDNTIIVLMGDNGLLEGEHGMVDKRTMHEPSIRIPLIVRFPALAAGKVIQEQVLTEDIAPSLLDLCGAKPLENIHGKSWAKLVREGDADWRKAWFYEYNYEKQFPYTPNVRGVRTDEWKYMRYPHGDGSPDRHMAELYHIQDDPEERHNLIADPPHAAKVAELQALLAKTMTESGLPPEKDTMPLDAGIKQALPDAKIR